MLAAVALAVTAEDARATPTARRRQMTRAVREVSHYLGNTPALTRLGEHGDFGRPATQGAVEAAVLALLGG